MGFRTSVGSWSLRKTQKYCSQKLLPVMSMLLHTDFLPKTPYFGLNKNPWAPISV